MTLTSLHWNIAPHFLCAKWTLPAIHPPVGHIWTTMLVWQNYLFKKAQICISRITLIGTRFETLASGNGRVVVIWKWNNGSYSDRNVNELRPIDKDILKGESKLRDRLSKRDYGQNKSKPNVGRFNQGNHRVLFTVILFLLRLRFTIFVPCKRAVRDIKSILTF